MTEMLVVVIIMKLSLLSLYFLNIEQLHILIIITFNQANTRILNSGRNL